MIGDPFTMVVAIILIVTIGKIISSRHRAQNGIISDRKGNERIIADPDAGRMKEEIRTLKERIAVLERIATDDRGAKDLTREIEQLRDR